MAQTFESRAWESVARGGICGAGAESAAMLGDVVCDTGDVDVVAAEEVDENIGVGVPAVGEERSQWRMATFRATGDEDRVHEVPC